MLREKPLKETDFEDFVPDAPPPVREEEPSYRDNLRLQKLIEENARRQTESLKIYQPSEQQERFHASHHRERVIRGGKRSGKSVCAGVEIARAVTGQDPHRKYPRRDGVVAAIGLNADHCGKVMWRYLGGQGAFKIIRDAKTGLWRTWKPRDPKDAAKADEVCEAPALVPSRFIQKIAWEKKSAGIPRIVRFTTGWQLWFYSSMANVPRGFQADICWLDEELANPEWYREMRARLIDRAGCLIWSATPQAGTECLYDLILEAEKGNPNVMEVRLRTADNQYLEEASVQAFAMGMTDEQRRVDMEGEFLLSGLLVYPEFRRGGVHYEPYFRIPEDWSRYLAIDPGRQRCAVLFMAVPPPEYGDTRFVYDECYIKNCDADLFAQEVKVRSQGVVYEAMLIDQHAAGVVEMGSGQSVGDQYLAALKRHGVECGRGPGFVDGSGDSSIKAGILAVREWLRVRANGSVRLKVIEERCPNLVWEFERYRYERNTRDMSVKETVEKRNDHLMDALRYLCMYDPPYRRPKRHTPPDSPAVRAMQMEKQKGYGRNPGPLINLGPRAA